MTTDFWTTPDVVGYAAAAAVFLTFCMRTMLSLRLVAIASNLIFMGYAWISDLRPILVLHALLLPMNVYRLIQLERQVRRAKAATLAGAAEERFDWLIPLGRNRFFGDGQTVFSKGEMAESMFVVIDGIVLLPELGVRLGQGALLGEIALFSGNRTRMASAVAEGPVKLSEITERRMQELYFDNPNFAFALTRLITGRLGGATQPEALEEASGTV